MNFLTLQNACRPHKLSLSGLAIMQIIVFKPYSLSDVAAMARVSESAMTQLADHLERRGLAERKPGKDDRRKIFLHPTMFGREVFDQMISAGTRKEAV